MNDAPSALKAMLDPDPLTLGQVALLDMAASPLLRGDVSSLPDVLASLWLLDQPLAEAARLIPEAPSRCLEWASAIGPDGYRARLRAALDGLAAFYALLPAPEDAQKKTPAPGAASSPSSPSSSAEPTP